MARTLLIRGMLVGLFAGFLMFGFARIYGEPQVDRAIAFETAADAAKAKAAAVANPGAPIDEPEPELVSRPMQAGLGLFTGVTVYGTAFGGLFALVFAYAYGRAGSGSPRTVASVLAACGLIALYIVPTLKYPANPPAVGEPETIALRTGLYFTMLAISVGAMVAAALIRKRLVDRSGAWPATLWAAAFYVAAVAPAGALLPVINEVPDDFPAVVLWKFRVASLGMQAVMWTTLGLAFGTLTERALAIPRGMPNVRGLRTLVR
jgi:predicted cobalt transporter CbtA